MIARTHPPHFSLDRLLALALVAGGHLALVYYVATSGLLRPLTFEDPPERLQARIPQVDPRPLPQPTAPDSIRAELRASFEPRIEEPRQDLVLEPTDLATTGEASAPPAYPTATGERAEAPARSVEATPLSWRERRSPREYYPATSLRLGEEGVVTVRVCVDAGGALRSPPDLVSSSGHSRLDAAALAWAREALRFTPATRDGVPVEACKSFRVNFVITR